MLSLTALLFFPEHQFLMHLSTPVINSRMSCHVQGNLLHRRQNALLAREKSVILDAGDVVPVCVCMRIWLLV